MERSVAVKKLAKILGKNLGYRVNPKALTGDDKEAAHQRLQAAVAERNRLRDEREKRREVILAADQEFQSLAAATKLAEREVHELQGDVRASKITVGVMNSMFFHIKAEGDSWEEVIEKLGRERAPS